MAHIHIDLKKLKHRMHGKREAVAKHLGLHPNSISRKLSGKQAMTVDEVNIIADFLGDDATEFLILNEKETQWRIVRIHE